MRRRQFDCSKRWQSHRSSDAFGARIELGRLYSGLGTRGGNEKALDWYQAALALADDREDSEELREARNYVARTSGNAE
jgi:hypothetical protein